MKRLLILSLIALVLSAGCSSMKGNDDVFTVGIAWRDDTKSDAYNRLVSYFEMAGCRVIDLGKARTSDLEYYENGTLSDDYLNFDFSLTDEASEILWNTEEIIVPSEINDVDIIVFSGGEDVSPALYRKDYEPDFDYMYNTERDASDFLLMRYAIENDIPVLGICRGMQVMAVASGLRLVEDIPSDYPDLEGVHRTADSKYSFHSVDITDNSSILYKLTQSDELAETASSHHQSVLFEPGHSLADTAYSGPILEGMERTDKSFIVGVQFHPEYYSVHQDMKGAADAMMFIENVISYLD